MEVINLIEYINNKKTLHNDNIFNYIDGLIFFLENQDNYDIISYLEIKKYMLINMDILMINNENNYYYDFLFSRIGDYISDIKFISKNDNIKLEYYIGDNKFDFDIIKDFLIVSALYHEFKLRIIFLDKLIDNYEFEIKYLNYIMDNDIRYELKKNIIKSNNFLYQNGICNYDI